MCFYEHAGEMACDKCACSLCQFRHMPLAIRYAAQRVSRRVCVVSQTTDVTIELGYIKIANTGYIGSRILQQNSYKRHL